MKHRIITLLCYMSFTLMASVQASGGQIIPKSRSGQRTTSSANSTHNRPNKKDNKGMAELELIRRQGAFREQSIQDELLRTDDNSRKCEILRTASSDFESSKDYERAIKFYNQYLSISPRLTSDDLDCLAKMYSHLADFLGEYKLDEYRKEMLLKAVEVYHRIGDSFPRQKVYAAYQCATMNNKLDKNGEKSLAKPDYLKVVELLESKANRSKGEDIMLKYSLHYLMANEFLVGKNKSLAKVYANKILAIDSNYAPALQIRDIE